MHVIGLTEHEQAIMWQGQAAADYKRMVVCRDSYYEGRFGTGEVTFYQNECARHSLVARSRLLIAIEEDKLK